MDLREQRKQKMIRIVEEKLPDFARIVKTTKDEIILLHQDSFAADYQEVEFSLLGMAIKYAGQYRREITIVAK